MELLAIVQELWERPTDRAMLIIVLALALASLAIMIYAIVSDAIESSGRTVERVRELCTLTVQECDPFLA